MINYCKIASRQSPVASRQSPVASRQSPVASGRNFYCKKFWSSQLQKLEYSNKYIFIKIKLIILIKKIILHFYKYINFYKNKSNYFIIYLLRRNK
jgi:hypothetical protein